MIRKAASLSTFTLLVLAVFLLVSLNATQAQTSLANGKETPKVFVENNGTYGTHYLYLADAISTIQPEHHTETYSIDGSEAIPITMQNAVMTDKGGFNRPPTYQVTIALPYLPDGFHTITIQGGEPYMSKTRLGDYWSFHYTMNFTIDTTNIAITELSIKNQTYPSTNSITLNCVTNKTAAWMGYSIDGNQTITFMGNTTLPTLADGSHTLTVNANDTAGHMNTALVYFTVAPSTWPFAVAASTTIAVAAGVVVALRKCRK